VLYRDDPAGPVAITQPAHAWVSGQLARAWGNDQFPRPEPWEEICVAAERHDDGWLAWEAAPARDPATGWPYSFRTLPRAAHLAIWSTAASLVLALGRYPALLVSLHGTGLYAGVGNVPDDEEVTAIAEFLRQQRILQDGLIVSLRADPQLARFTLPDAIDRNRRLIGVWDALSLAICGGQRASRRFDGIPASNGDASLTLAPAGDDATRFATDPWPFRDPTVPLRFEGRRLEGQFSDEESMRDALLQAPWTSYIVELAPASGV
jgi:hypothetical protein